MNKIFFILVACVFSLISYADEEKCRNRDSKWLECSRDSDCVIVSNPCGHPTEAANLKHSKIIEACNANLGASLSCPRWNEGRDGKTKAACVKKICSAVKVSISSK